MSQHDRIRRSQEENGGGGDLLSQRRGSIIVCILLSLTLQDLSAIEVTELGDPPAVFQLVIFNKFNLF